MSSPLFPLREGPGTLLAAKAGAGQQPASGDQLPPAGAWKREMERAQLDSWFKPRQAAPGAEGRPEGASGRALKLGEPYPMPPKSAMKADAHGSSSGLTASHVMASRAPGMQASGVSAAYLPKFETGRMPAADIRLAVLAAALARAARLKVTELAPGFADPAEIPADAPGEPDALGARSEEPDPDSQAIRLHAEWHGQDVSVWLGIDARDETEADQIAQLLPHIRACLQEQRSRLVKLVCNGKTVFEVSSPFMTVFPYFTQPKEFP